MKHLLLILLIIFIDSGLLFCQQKDEKKKSGKGSTFGINAGVFFSNYAKGKSYGYVPLGSPSGIEITYEDRFRTGYTFGIFTEILKTGSFSFQPEINYVFSEHDIKYYKWATSGPLNNKYSADYILRSSAIHICFIADFSLGKKSNPQFLAGPYFWIPVSSQYTGEVEQLTYNSISKTGTTRVQNASSAEDILRGGIGALCGFRINFPFGKNYLALEIKAGRGLSDITSSPNMKETYASLTFLYSRKIVSSTHISTE